MELHRESSPDGPATQGPLEAGVHTSPSPTGSGDKTIWSVVVLYEKPEARELAVQFCGQLVERFWARCDFAVTWWPFELLAQGQAAREAADKAAASDLMVFAGDSQGEVPIGVRAWLDAWATQRGEREGALVAVLQTSEASVGPACERLVYLRHLAHRAGMDFLTDIPAELSRCMPETFESYSERAGHMTSLLDGILHQHPRPPALH